MMNGTKRIQTVMRIALVALAVLFVLIVLVLRPLFGDIPFIWPESIKPAAVESISIIPAEGYANDLPEKGPFSATDDDRAFLLSVINGAWRIPFVNDDYKPTYDALYRIYLTVDIKLYEEGKMYKLLYYSHKDWSIVRGETEYKLALVREENGQSKMWQLPYEACYKAKDWYRDWYMDKVE